MLMLYIIYTIVGLARALDNQQIEGNFRADTLTSIKTRFQNVISIEIRITKRLSTYIRILPYPYI